MKTVIRTIAAIIIVTAGSFQLKFLIPVFIVNWRCTTGDGLTITAFVVSALILIVTGITMLTVIISKAYKRTVNNHSQMFGNTLEIPDICVCRENLWYH
jgi:hypothetical protein